MMNLKTALSIFLSTCTMYSLAQRPALDREQVRGGELIIQPFKHATLALNYHHKNIYVDPTGGAVTFAGLDAPDIILITDIHGDHCDTATLKSITAKHTVFVVPQSVADKLVSFDKTKMVILNNGEKKNVAGFDIEAIPMYNLPESDSSRHTKGRGNGYVLTIGEKNIYISGDTEDIPEMRALKNIDIAFVCMNLPYTMDIQQAADAVLDFKPKIVYPYHYRGQDTEAFKTLVIEKNPAIEVRLRNWYMSPK